MDDGAPRANIGITAAPLPRVRPSRTPPTRRPTVTPNPDLPVGRHYDPNQPGVVPVSSVQQSHSPGWGNPPGGFSLLSGYGVEPLGPAVPAQIVPAQEFGQFDPGFGLMPPEFGNEE